jgi:class 3 adenylate cyclase
MTDHAQDVGPARGTEVKAMGDGFMASFGRPEGSGCAIALQRNFAAIGVLAGHGGALHIGVNAGGPIARMTTCSAPA